MATTPRRRITTLILGLLVSFMGAGSLLLAAGGARTNLEAPGQGPVVGSGASVTALPDGLAALGPQLGVPAKAGTGRTAPWDGARDVNDLPAWRWRSIDLDVDTSGGFMGVAGSFKQIPVTIAEMLFSAANFFWQIVLLVLKLGFESDGLITAGTQSINTGAAFMANKLLFFAIPLGAIVVWRFVREFLKLKGGNPFGLFRALTVFAVAFGMVYMVVDRSSYAITNHRGDKEAQLRVPGTIPWMASQILDLVDKATGPITEPVIGVKVGDDTVESVDKTIAGEDGDLTTRAGGVVTTSAGPTTCVNYIESIYGAYAEGPKAERTLIVVSRLWESTFYESWKSSAFGEPTTYRSASGAYASDIPERVMCHYAESVNDVSAEEQQKIANAAYGPAVPAYSDAGSIPTVFGPFDASNNKEQRKAMTAWAACRWTGSAWDGQIEFDGSWADDGTTNPYDGLCSGVMTGTGDFDDKFYVFSGDVKEATSRGDAEHREQLKAARSYGLAYSGGNAGGRIISGAIALLVAIAFVVTFGFLGLGLMIAMMLAVAFLALALPAALVLAAIGRTRQAQPLFKMTLMSLLSHGFLTVILSLIIIISGIFRALLTNFDEMPLLIRSITNGMAPVAAFFAVRKVMKSLGMADILTPSGAMSFAGAAALKAGEGEFSAKSKRMTSGDSLKKAPGIGKKLEKLDRYAPTYANWSEKGRKDRAKAVKEEDEKETKRRQERIQKRTKAAGGELGRYGRLRNKIDNKRIPGTTRDRLKEIADNRAARLGKKGVKPGLAAAALIGSGPAGWGVLAAGALAGAGWHKWRAGRAPGTPVDADEATDMLYSKAQIRRGRDVDAFRTEAVRNNKNFIDTQADAVARGLEITEPSSTEIERAQEGIRVAVTDMVGAFAEALTGSRELLTEAQRDGLRISAGREEGYPPRAILATAGGVVLPTPYDTNRKRLELSDDQLGHFVHWLPKEDRERREIRDTDASGRVVTRLESESEYGTRLLATGIARGVAHPDGQMVDVLALKGIDSSTKEGKKIIADWRRGEPNEILDTLQIVEVDSAMEKKVVTAALEVARKQEMQVTISQVNSEMAAFGVRAENERVRTEAWRRGEPDGPSSASRDAAAMAESTAQLLVAVNAAKDLFEKARNGGDADALNKAAQRMSLTMQKLEESQEQLVDRLGLSMAESFEKQLAAQELRDEKFAESFEKSFEQGVDRIESVVGGVSQALDAFKQGALDLQGTLKILNETMNREKKESSDAGARLQEVLSNLEKTAKTAGSSRAGQADWGMPNARDVADVSGANPIPDTTQDGR
jgi:hypothetical protein